MITTEEDYIESKDWELQQSKMAWEDWARDGSHRVLEIRIMVSINVTLELI